MVIYEAVGPKGDEHFLITCLAFVVITQLIGVSLFLILMLSSACLITGIILAALEPNLNAKQPF